MYIYMLNSKLKNGKNQKKHKNYKHDFYYYHFLAFSQKQQKLFKTSQRNIEIPNTEKDKTAVTKTDTEQCDRKGAQELTHTGDRQYLTVCHKQWTKFIQ